MTSTAASFTPPPAPPRGSPKTMADLLRELGDVPADRVLLHPAPGTATEQDLLRLVERKEALVELVDGTLVEKPVGSQESYLVTILTALLWNFVSPRNLGLVYGPDTMLRMKRQNIRLPDVSFIAWDDIPAGTVPREPVPTLPATLAVELLSPSNTKPEMSQKRREYFESGTKLIWEIDPPTRTVAVYTPAHELPRMLSESDTLDGGDVLPGFTLPLRDLFAELDRRAG